MDKQIEVLIKKDDTVPFHNKACYCIGTRRMNLALKHEYHNSLKRYKTK